MGERRRRSMKKLLSGLLTLAMVLQTGFCVPITVSAAEDEGSQQVLVAEEPETGDESESGEKAGNEDAVETGEEAGSGDETETGEEAGSGDETETGEEAGNGDETETGEEAGSGDETETGEEAGSGDESESGEEAGSGDETETGEETESEGEDGEETGDAQDGEEAGDEDGEEKAAEDAEAVSENDLPEKTAFMSEEDNELKDDGTLYLDNRESSYSGEELAEAIRAYTEAGTELNAIVIEQASGELTYAIEQAAKANFELGESIRGKQLTIRYIDKERAGSTVISVRVQGWVLGTLTTEGETIAFEYHLESTSQMYSRIEFVNTSQAEMLTRVAGLETPEECFGDHKIAVEFLVDAEESAELYQETGRIWTERTGFEELVLWTEEKINGSQAGCERTEDELTVTVYPEEMDAEESFIADIVKLFGSQERRDGEKGEENWLRLNQLPNIGRDTYTDAELERIHLYYNLKVDSSNPITGVDISLTGEQGKDVIPASLVNGLKKLLLYNEEDKFLNFCYSDEIWDEEQEKNTNGYWYDITLKNPGDQEEDVSLSVTVGSASANQAGVKVTLNKPLSFADTEHVDLQIGSHLDTPDGLNMKKSLLGEDAGIAEGEGALLAASESVAEGYYNCSNADICIGLSGADKIPIGKSYTFLPLTQTEEPETYQRGSEVQLTTAGTPDKGKKVTWKCYSPDKASIDANGEAAVFGWAGDSFLYSASYVSGGKSCMELRRGEIVSAKLDRLFFAEDKIEIELSEEEIEEGQTACWLELRTDPADTGVDWTELQWVSSDKNEANPVMVSDGEHEWCDGEIQINTSYRFNDNNGFAKVSIRDTKITVSYPQGEGEAPLTAEATIRVIMPLTDEELGLPDMKTAVVLKNFDTKLSAIDPNSLFPEKSGESRAEGTWEWEDGDISLASCDGFCDFNAVFTAEDGRTAKRLLSVRVLSLSGVSIEQLHLDAPEQEDKDCVSWGTPDTIWTADGQVLGLDYLFYDGSENIRLDAEARQELMTHYQESYKTVWDLGSLTAEDVTQEAGYWQGSKQITGCTNTKAVSTQSITVQITTTGSKPKTLAKQTLKVKVVSEQAKCLNTEDLTLNETELKALAIGANGTLRLVQKKSGDAYYKLTVKSSDSSVLSLGKAKVTEGKDGDKDIQIMEIPCTRKSDGMTCITVTAKDDAATTQEYSLTWKSTEGKLSKDRLTINRRLDGSLEDTDAEALVYLPGADVTLNSIKVTVDGDLNGKLGLYPAQLEESLDGVAMLTLKGVAEEDLPAKTYKNVKVRISVKYSDEGGEEQSWNVTFAQIKITDQKPKVSIKQTKKVNLCYTEKQKHDIHCGVLIVSEDVIPDPVLTDCDYEIDPTKAAESETITTYQLKQKSDTTGKDKDGTLTYRVRGYRGVYTAKLKVAAEDKVQSVTLSAKANTLYPKWDCCEVTPHFLNAEEEILSFGEAAENDAVVELQDKAGEWIEVSTEMVAVALKKNTYNVVSRGDYLDIILSGEGYQSGTDTIKFRVTETGSRKSVMISYKLTVDASAKTPKLELKNSKLTLNANEECWKADRAITEVWFKGYDKEFPGSYSMYFAGKDKKSQALLRDTLKLEYWPDQEVVSAQINSLPKDKDIKGTYKFIGRLDYNGRIISTEFSITIKNQKPELKKAGGAIDLLSDSELLYNIKANGLNSNMPVFAWMEDQGDGALFSAYINEKNQLAVCRQDDMPLSTKRTYNAWVNIEMQDGYGNGITVKLPIQIKVKQSKPKLTLKPSAGSSGVIYRQYCSTAAFDLRASVNGTEIPIEAVYTEDANFYVDYDGDNGVVTLVPYENPNGLPKAFLKSGKKYSVKLYVRYKNQGTDQKPAVINCPVVIK